MDRRSWYNLLGRIKGNIWADVLILYKSSIIRWSLIICVMIISLVLYESSSLFISDVQIGYYINQLLITSSQFNVFVLVIAGAYIGASDFEWQTYCLRNVNSNRFILWLSRMLLVLVASILFVSANIFIGIFFDVVGGSLEVVSINFFFKYFCVVIIVFFWGSFSYLLGSISRSFAISSSFVIGYILLESVFIRFIPDNLSRFLPIWNQKSLLLHFFSVREGAVAIVQQVSGNYLVSMFVIVFYIVIIGVFSLLINNTLD